MTLREKVAREIEDAIWLQSSKQIDFDAVANRILEIPEIAGIGRLLERLRDARQAIESLDQEALGRHPETGHSFRAELLHYIDEELERWSAMPLPEPPKD